MRTFSTPGMPGRRRGGLARIADASVLLPPPLPRAAAVERADVPPLSIGTLRRVAWTLPYAAFIAYIVSVVTNRFQVAVVAIPIAVLGVVMQGNGLRLGTLVPSMAALLGWSLLGVTTSEYPELATEGVTDFAKLVLIVFAGVNALRSRTQVRVYMGIVLIAFMAYPGKGTLFNYLTGNLRQGRAAWSGTYGNPNDMAAISILVLSIALALLAYRMPKWSRLATVASACFIVFLIFITQSRGAVIGLALFTLLLVLRSSRRQRTKVLVGIALAGSVLATFAPASVWTRLAGLQYVTDEASGQRDSSSEQRLELWRVARTIIAEHPVTGVGLGVYSKIHGRTALRSDFKPIARGERDAHSTYLSVAAETGLVGASLFIAIIFLTLRFAERVRRRALAHAPEDARALLLLELGFLAYLIAAVWGSFARLNMPYLHLLLIWALAETMRRDLQRADAGTPALR